MEINKLLVSVWCILNNHSPQFTFGFVTRIEMADKRIDLERIYKFLDTNK